VINGATTKLETKKRKPLAENKKKLLLNLRKKTPNPTSAKNDLLLENVVVFVVNLRLY